MYDGNLHYGTIFEILAIVMYQYMILYAHQEMNATNKELVQHFCISEGDHNYAMQWLQLEIYAFFTNLVVLMLILLLASHSTHLIPKTEKKQREENMLKKIDNYFSDHDKKYFAIDYGDNDCI